VICPACQNKLKAFHFAGYDLDACLRCRGVWFDDGEFLGFTKKISESVESEDKRTLFKPRHVIGSETVLDRRIRTCPRCGTAMKQYNYAYDSNIFLDRCPQCGGIWTDAGEIRRVAVHLKKDPRVEAIGASLLKNKKHKDAGGIGDFLMTPMPYVAFAPRLILPLCDDLTRRCIPWVTISLIALCSLIFSYVFFPVGDIKSFYDTFAYKPVNLISIGLLSSIFLHGGWLHLIGNMYFLWLFGDNVEDRQGWWKFALFYLAAGLVANLFYTIFHAASTTPLVGASGAIAGVMGAYIVYHPRANIKTLMFYRVMDIPAGFYLGFWFLLQVIYGSVESISFISNVAYTAHIGGFLFGLGFALIDKYIFSRKSSPASTN
jgi:membrane associated rhomboid family serine protease